MLSVEDAFARIAGAFVAMPAEWVQLADGVGRVLAADLSAPRDQPPAAVSAMDGYAVRAADLAAGEAVLDVIGEVPAGAGFAGEVTAGQAVRIFTGAVLPQGADAIAIQEDTEPAGPDRVRVRVRGSVAPGTFVRPAGLDFRVGEVLLPAATQLGPRDLGLAAAAGHVWLPVRRRARVGVLGTGDELVRPGTAPGPSRIVGSNNVTLAAMVAAWGAQAHDLGLAPDRADALAESVAAAQGLDLLLTSGGASVGDYDLVQSALGPAGLELDFWKIAMRPGKPLIFGRLGTVPLLGLPGNPVSAGVCAALFARAAIRVMHGLPPEPPAITAVLGTDLPANDRRQDYLRARLAFDDSGRQVATPWPKQDSSMFALFARADGLIVRPPHDPPRSAGDPVRVVPLRADTIGA